MTSRAAANAGRHFFVLVGGFITLWSLLTIFYLLFFRVPVSPCTWGEISVGDGCLAPWTGLVPIAIIGAALWAVGYIAFRVRVDTPEQVLRAGAGMRLTLLMLASLGVVPILYAAIAANLAQVNGREELVRWGGFAYDAIAVMGIVSVLSLLAFFSALGVHLFHDHLRRKFLQWRAYEAEKEARQQAQAAQHVPPPPGKGKLPQEGFRWKEA